MNIEEVQYAIKQLGKELYEDNPERQARGPFSADMAEAQKMTREEKLADIEAYQAEMIEKEAYRDALMTLEDRLLESSPSVGEKLIIDFMNFYPMGKRSSTGIGSLVGKEIGEADAAEQLLIDQAQADVIKFDQIAQDGEPLSDVQKLQQRQAEGILKARPSKAGAMTTEEYFEKISSSGKDPTSPQMLDDFLKYQESKGRTKISGIWFTREEWERLMDEDFSDIEAMSEAEMDLIQKYNLEAAQLPKGPPKELNFNTQEKQGIMSMLSETPLSPEAQARNLISETPTTGEADPIVEDIKKGLYDANRYWQAGVDEDSSLYDALENYKNLDLEGQEQVKDMLREDMFERLGLEDARAEVKFFSDSGAFDAELVDQYLNKGLAGAYPKIFGNPRSYKSGGYVMNLGDYGRSYK